MNTNKVKAYKVLVSCTFLLFYQCGGQMHEVHETTTFLLVTLPNIHRLKKILTDLAIVVNK